MPRNEAMSVKKALVENGIEAGRQSVSGADYSAFEFPFSASVFNSITHIF